MGDCSGACGGWKGQGRRWEVEEGGEEEGEGEGEEQYRVVSIFLVSFHSPRF